MLSKQRPLLFMFWHFRVLFFNKHFNLLNITIKDNDNVGIYSVLFHHICSYVTWLMYKIAGLYKQQAENTSFLTHRTSGCCREWGHPPEEPAAGGTAVRSLHWSHPSSRYRCGGHSNQSHPSWDSTLGDTVSRTSAWFKWVMLLITHLITLMISSPLKYGKYSVSTWGR